MKLDLHNKLKFPELEFQKKWYIATYFANSGMLLIIFVKNGKWPISPT